MHATCVKFPLRASRGLLSGTGSVSTDVTDRKRAEAAMRKSEDRLRGLIEGIPQLVWRATDGGRFTWTSPQWERITGLSDEDSRGRGWLSAIHPDDRADVLAARENARSEGLLEVECRVRRAMGEGLPPRSGAPVSGGYGCTLIERALPYVLEARTSFGLGDEELICTIDMPLPAREAEDRTIIG
jgi:PAS domain S-box-containing protein